MCVITSVLGSNPGSRTGGQPASSPLAQSLIFNGSGFLPGVSVSWSGIAAGAAYPPQVIDLGDSQFIAVVGLPVPGEYVYVATNPDGEQSPPFSVQVL